MLCFCMHVPVRVGGRGRGRRGGGVGSYGGVLYCCMRVPVRAGRRGRCVVCVCVWGGGGGGGYGMVVCYTAECVCL